MAFAIVFVEAEEIDRINILQATKQAMVKAVQALSVKPEGLLIDGNQAIAIDLPQLTLVGGDHLNASIAAASILAKTARDALMVELDARHPGYGFAKHKGYGTALHMAALEKLGACPIHRRSFAPVRRALETNP